MKRYLAIFVADQAVLEQFRREAEEAKRPIMDPERMKPWSDWMKAHADSIVETAPLGRTKKVSPEGTSDIRNDLTGYIVVQAESHDAAAKLFEHHPHFTNLPGSSVQIMECLEVPGT